MYRHVMRFVYYEYMLVFKYYRYFDILNNLFFFRIQKNELITGSYNTGLPQSSLFLYEF